MISLLVSASDYPWKVAVRLSSVAVMNSVTKCRLGRTGFISSSSLQSLMKDRKWRQVPPGRNLGAGSGGRYLEAGTWGRELKQGRAGLLTLLLNSDIPGIVGKRHIQWDVPKGRAGRW